MTQDLHNFRNLRLEIYQEKEEGKLYLSLDLRSLESEILWKRYNLRRMSSMISTYKEHTTSTKNVKRCTNRLDHPYSFLFQEKPDTGLGEDVSYDS